MDNPDTVERVVSRAIHEHLSRRDIMQYLDNDEDCLGLARAAIAALTTPADGLGEELAERLGLVLETNLPDGEWDMRTFDATRTLMAKSAKRILTALRAAQPTERAEAFMEAAATCDAMSADKSLPADAHTAAWNLAVGFRYKARQAIERTDLTPTDTPATMPTMTYAPPHLEYAATDQHDAWLLRFADQDCREQWFGGDGYTPEETRALAIDAWNRHAPAWSVRLMRTVTLAEVRGADTPATASRDAGEALGDALFRLSERLRDSGFLENDANHAAYERVVAAFLATPPEPSGQSDAVGEV